MRLEAEYPRLARAVCPVRGSTAQRSHWLVHRLSGCWVVRRLTRCGETRQRVCDAESARLQLVVVKAPRLITL